MDHTATYSQEAEIFITTGVRISNPTDGIV
jgi:hypothetical protein